MTVEAVLGAARGLITTPDKWSQFAIARKGEDIPCGPLTPDANKLDCLGSVELAVQNLGLGRKDFNFAHTELQRRMRLAWGYRSTDVDKFNDFRTHSEVMQLMGGDGADPDPFDPLPPRSELVEWDNQIKDLLAIYPGHWYEAADRGSQTTFPQPFMPYGDFIKTEIPHKVFAITDKAYDYRTEPLEDTLENLYTSGDSQLSYDGTITIIDGNTLKCEGVTGSITVLANDISDEEEIVVDFGVAEYVSGGVHILNYDAAPADRVISSNETLQFRMIRRGSQTGKLNITFDGGFTGNLNMVINRHVGLPLGADDVELHVDESGAYFHSQRGYSAALDWPGFRAPFTRFDYGRPDLSMYRTIHVVMKADAVTLSKNYRMFNLIDPVNDDQDWYSAGIEFDAGVYANGENKSTAFYVKQTYHTGKDGGLPPASRPGFGNWNYNTSFSTYNVPVEERYKQLIVVSFVCFIHPTLASKDQAPLQWIMADGRSLNVGSRGWTAQEMPDGAPRGFGPHRVGFAMGYTSASGGADVHHEMGIREFITHAGLPTRAEYDAIHQALIEKHAYITEYVQTHQPPAP